MDLGHQGGDDMRMLAELIKGFRVAMLTTVQADGKPVSRPMATVDAEFDGELWFFTSLHSTKVDEIQHHDRVNVCYVDVDTNRYVCVTGTAQLVRDEQKARELWHPAFRACFPNGLKDQELALLKISVEHAEYWDSPTGTPLHLAEFNRSRTAAPAPGRTLSR